MNRIENLKKTKLVVIPGGLTKLLQPLDNIDQQIIQNKTTQTVAKLDG